MSTPAPGRFEAVLYRGRALPEAAKPPTTFEPCRDGVLRHDGGRTSLLSPQEVTDLLGLYEREKEAAQRVADHCDALHNALWAARCDALDRCGAEAAA
jgi:hypothetical protein